VRKARNHRIVQPRPSPAPKAANVAPASKQTSASPLRKEEEVKHRRQVRQAKKRLRRQHKRLPLASSAASYISHGGFALRPQACYRHGDLLRMGAIAGQAGVAGPKLIVGGLLPPQRNSDDALMRLCFGSVLKMVK